MANPKVEVIKRPAEQIGSDIKKSAWSAVFESIVIIILGILFVIWPDTMMNAVAYIVGTVFIIKGGFEVVNYFLEKGQKDFYNDGLLTGVVSVLIGIAALIAGDRIANVFRIIVGVFIIYEALVRANIAIKLHSAGMETWKYVLVIALAVMVLGIFVIVNDIAAIIGWILIGAGVIGIIGDILFVNQLNTLINRLTNKQ